MRLDVYLATYWPEKSRSQWQKLIKNGSVMVDDETCTDVSAELGEDSVVEPKIDTTLPTEINIPIIYQDDHVVVYNKPPGVLTHAKGELAEEFTVADAARKVTSDGLDTNRPGIVHRLDRDTSGILIVAKDTDTKRALQKQFQDRKAKKTYIAIVRGTPKLDNARIDLPIERNPKKPSTFRVGASGKAALTEYKVIASNGRFSVVELKPTTGRTHQLRVHMAHIGAPIAGDVVYGGGKSPIGRLCLHAQSLEITVPTSQRKTFVAELPTDFAQAIEEI